jgi:hypothetical protein
MEYIAYVDESGTHDKTGKTPGSAVGILSGYVAPIHIWEKFNMAWQAVLTKHKAQCFHFYDFAEASGVKNGGPIKSVSGYKKNIFKDWDLNDLNVFFEDCVRLLGFEGITAFGSQILTAQFHEQREQVALHPWYAWFINDPYRLMVHVLFENFERQTQIEWKSPSDTVAFIFDQNDDTTWTDGVRMDFKAYQCRNNRYKSVDFADKDIVLPLQASLLNF